MAEEKKFDFQNIDVKLYLALQAMTTLADAEVSSLFEVARRDGDGQVLAEAEQAYTKLEAARLAMEEFELSHGPLPEWAIDRNWDHSLVAGAQLCTRDGRRTGNAHIVHVTIPPTPEAVPYYHCLTDAGNEMRLSASELEGMYSIGDYISDPKRIINHFDRSGHYADLLKCLK